MGDGADEDQFDDSLAVADDVDDADSELNVDEDDFDDEDWDSDWDAPPPPPVRSMIGAAMVGLHNAIYGEKEKPAMIMEAAGAPPNEDFELDFDPDDPSATKFIVHRQPTEPTPD